MHFFHPIETSLDKFSVCLQSHADHRIQHNATALIENFFRRVSHEESMDNFLDLMAGMGVAS